MVGGGAIVTQDIPPYVNAAGNRARMYGLNLIGLKRNGFSRETVATLKRVYRLLFRSAGLTLIQRTTQAREMAGDFPEAESMIAFVEASERGICQGRWEKKGSA
jgi:UDP-N-acetylglucosamine acyltransferase